MPLPLIAAIVAVASAALILAYLRRSRGGEATPPGETGDGPWPQLPNGAEKAEPDAVERSKQAIHGILRDISAHIRSLAGENVMYGASLDKHKASLKETARIESLQELGQALAAELESMQRSNTEYRQRLAEANEVVVRQQDDLDKLQSTLGTDFLTDVPNRRSFDEQLAGAIELAKRHGDPVSLLVIDIDHFKSVNDMHGHAAGDRVLKAVAKILNDTRRASDFLARYGGEEFVMILPQTSADQALAVADRLREKVASTRLRLENTGLNVTVSMGAGEVFPESDTKESLFARVDGALYRAKHEGRNCVRLAEVSTGQ